jgi:putative Holliday junction resolvase
MGLSMANLYDDARTAVSILPKGKRMLGLDLGTKTIGMATSDLTGQVATPRETIRRTKFMADAKALLAFAEKEDIGLLVLGLPFNMDGSEGPRAQATRAFARNLAKISPLPLAYWDERLSTAAVTRTMLEADISRAKRAENVDKLAAAYILQAFLDSLRNGEG